MWNTSGYTVCIKIGDPRSGFEIYVLRRFLVRSPRMQLLFLFFLLIVKQRIIYVKLRKLQKIYLTFLEKENTLTRCFLFKKRDMKREMNLFIYLYLYISK